MRLYHSPTSPYVRKVMLLIREAGLTDSVTLVSAAGTPLEPGTLPLMQNPLGKIPVLETPDGSIYDSRVICRYLDAHAGAGAYPTGAALWQTLTLEALADGILDAALLLVYETRLRPEGLRFQPWTDGQWSKIARAIDALEGEWIGHLTVQRGGCPDMGQMAVAAALGYLDFRLGAQDWRAGHPALAAWATEFMARPAFLTTIPAA
jgi:glutathione S-transferase